MNISIYLKLLDKFDFATFGALVLLNIYLWKKDTKSCLYYVLFMLVLGIVLPTFSNSREVNRYVSDNSPIIDTFETSYSLLVFPVYWVLLVIQFLYLIFKPKISVPSSDQSLLDDL